MANCKFCGKPVRCARVHHAACWEREMEKIAEEICGGICKWPELCPDQDSLNERCDSCIMVKLLNLGL